MFICTDLPSDMHTLEPVVLPTTPSRPPIMTSAVLFYAGGMGFLYCYNCYIIHVNKTRSNGQKRNRNHTHTNSTVVLDGIILDTLHEETTSANSENMWATFLKRFFSGKSFRHPIWKAERRTFHKGFRNLRRRYR